MKLYKGYYVCIKKNAQDVENKLAYVVPLHGGEKTIEKQKEKGEQWSNDTFSWNAEYLNKASRDGKVSWYNSPKEYDQHLNKNSDKVERHLFLIKTGMSKTIVGYSDVKKIKVVSILGNGNISDDCVIDVINNSYYVYYKAIGTRCSYDPQKEVLRTIGYSNLCEDYNVLRNISHDINNVYIEKCKES